MKTPTYKSIYLYLTHDCDSWCSFCYRKGLYKRNNIKDLGDFYMSKETALKTLDFVFSKLQLTSTFNIYFWGGEPFLNFEVMKTVIDCYPQFHYHTNTNGKSITKEIYNYLDEHKNFRITWSLGNAYEKYGGIKQKVEAEYWAHKVISENDNSGANLMVTKYKNLVKDFEFVINNITPNITIDLATRYNHTDEDLNKFAEQYFCLMTKYMNKGDKYEALNPAFSNNLWHNEFGFKSLKKSWKFCRSGLERLFIDTMGGIWQCDNMYICQHNKLGDIYTGIDYSKLDLMWKIAENTDKYMSQYCEGCECYGNCPRNKCLGLDLEHMRNMFRPEPAYCNMCKIIYRISKKYVEYEKQKRIGVRND